MMWMHGKTDGKGRYLRHPAVEPFALARRDGDGQAVLAGHDGGVVVLLAGLDGSVVCVSIITSRGVSSKRGGLTYLLEAETVAAGHRVE